MHLKPFSILGYLVVCLVCLSQNAWADPHLQQGPMLGHVGSQEARIWVKASESARLTVILSQYPNLRDGRHIDGPMLTDDSDYNGHIQVTQLNPETRYYYDVLLDGVPCLTAPYPFFVTAPVEGESTHLRFAFGSCVGHEGRLAAAAWGQMAADKSIQMLLMLGDNHYADSTVPEIQRAAYYDHRAVSGFRDLVKRTSVYGIWDDHDYGPNDSDSTAEGRQTSLETFKSMWANPSYGEAR
jgi:alkaline phosphatase D